MTTPVTPLPGYLTSLVAKLHAHLDGAVTQSATKDIHQSRVATRRLKAGLDLFSAVLSKDNEAPLQKTLKRLRRRLGALRDHDVMLGHLKKVRRKRDAAPLVFLTGELQRQRSSLARKLARKIDLPTTHARLDEQWEPVRVEMLEAADAVPSLLRDSLLSQLEEFSNRADALSAEDAASSDEGRADPHELRIAGKSLRYTLEMLVEASGESAVPETVTSAFKRMQEHLGLWHDLVVLAQTALRLSLDHDLSLRHSSLQRGVLGLSEHLLKRAEARFADFAALWRQQGNAVRDSIQSLSSPAPAPITASAPGADAVSG